MRLRSGLAAIVAGVALAGCSSGPTVTTDVDPTAVLARYHTYSWISHKVPPTMNPLVFERIEQGIDRELAAKGYKKGEPADFAVTFSVGSRESIETYDYGPYATYYTRGGFVAYSSMGPATVRQITEGILVIDIFDTTTKRPVWHGMATKRLSSNAPDPAIVDGAVKAIIDELPAAIVVP